MIFHHFYFLTSWGVEKWSKNSSIRSSGFSCDRNFWKSNKNERRANPNDRDSKQILFFGEKLEGFVIHLIEIVLVDKGIGSSKKGTD